ncbi:MAG: hypothetical protein WD081_07220 [Gammaproteobacteria bacterium]
MTRVASVVLVLALAACAGPEVRGEIRYYTCDDGSGFNAELLGRTIKLHTATGVIELPRARSDGPGTLYSNGLRSVVINEDGSARHAIGRRAWAECTAG